MFNKISQRWFTHKSRKTLKDVYQFAAIIFGPRRLYSIKNFTYFTRSSKVHRTVK